MASDHPTGVITFLLSDVESSTRLWEADRAGMAASLETHDQIVRQAVDEHRGRVFSTAGDAFAVAFTAPDDAVAAAIAIQRRLAAAEWQGPVIKIRIGIHTGTAVERDNDYFGPTVNRTARIMGAGQGGRTLMSSVTVELLNPGGTYTLVERGSHRLSGLDEPEVIFELSHPEIPVVIGPLRTAEVIRTNLTEPLSSFVGRQSELADVGKRLATHRLVVLTGTGGTGKTRLAIEAGRAALEHHEDGVWLAELAPVSDPALVMTAIGDVFGLRPGEGATISEVVTRHLWPRDVLLIVDNCEHVLNGAADAIRLILAKAPRVRILATSRESLGLDGESLLRVPSLGLPDGSDGRRAAAVELFLDRAASSRSDFEPTEDDIRTIGWICSRVDGIPLGIELAAARLRTMTPRELAERLESSFRVLAGSEKTSLPRQRTLDATIDWSYELLEAGERVVFRRVSVFAGGFDLEAAEAVASDENVQSWEVLDHLDSLVDKSLVTPTVTPLGTRYRMLEPIRQYAGRLLVDSGEADHTRGAHARHFASFAAGTGPELRRSTQITGRQRIDADYDNIRLAFHHFLVSADFDRYLDLCFDLFGYWVHSGLHLEAIDTCVTGAERGSAHVDDLRLVKAWFVAAILGAEITQPESIDHARTGRAIARRMGDDNAIGRLELALGAAIRHTTTDPGFLAHLQEARRLLDGAPEPSWWEPEWDRAFRNFLFAGYLPHDDERSAEHLEAAVTSFERVGDRAMLAATLSEGIGSWGTGNDAQVLGNLRRALDIFEEVKVPYWEGHARMTLGTLLQMSGENEEAAVLLEQSAAQLIDCGDLACWATSLRGLSMCEAALGMEERACSRLVEVIEALDILPMPEVVLPRTLDACVAALMSAGRHEHAAIVLGCAEATPFPVPSVIPRTSRHAAWAESLAEALEAEQFARRRAEGAELDPVACLGAARSWLQD